LLPKLDRTNPPFLGDDDDDDDKSICGGIGVTGEKGENFSFPNLASWINGLATLLGGDPQKNGGGDEDTCVQKDWLSIP